MSLRVSTNCLSCLISIVHYSKVVKNVGEEEKIFREDEECRENQHRIATQKYVSHPGPQTFASLAFSFKDILLKLTKMLTIHLINW